MKLQYHKIRGVDKSVCTAEQKIAYNMASRIYGDIRFVKAWQQYDSGKVPAFLQNDWESKAKSLRPLQRRRNLQCSACRPA